MDWSELFTIRRILVATVASLLTATGSGGIIGVAQAGDEPMDLGFMQIPLPRIGDSAAYVHEIFEDGVRVQGPIETLAFTWGATETFYDADGQARLVNHLHVRERYSDVERERTYIVAGGSMQILGMLDVDESQRPTAGLPGGTTSTTTDVNTWFGAGWEMPCFARNPLQGQTLDLNDGFANPETCDGLYPTSGDYQLVAQGEGRYLFEAPRGHEASVSLLLEEGSAYPLQATVAQGGQIQTWTLHGLRAGGGTIATTGFDFDAPPAGVPRAQAINGPVLMWDGDMGNRHPFTLTDAYAAALSEPELQIWADDHPGHYVAYAGYVAYVQQGMAEPFWEMDWTDGEAFMQVRISRPASAIPIDGPNALLFDINYESGNWDEAPYWDGIYEYVERDLLPDSIFSASSVLDVWGHHTDDASSAGIGWSYFVGCRVGEPCEQAQAIVWAGRTASHIRQDGGDTTVTRWEIDTLRWQNGELSSRWDSTQDHRRSFSAPNNGPAADGSNMQIQGLAPVPSTGLQPLEIAATAAGIGLLTGLLVWTWPFLKHAGVMMFTRVRQDRILDHPVRSQLMATIRAEPGMHHQELVRAAGVGKGATEQHLRKLKGAGLVSMSGGKGYTCYFPKGAVDRRVMEAAPVLKAKAARAIVQYVGGRPGARAVEIRQAIGISASTLHYHMKRLEGAGVIEVRKAGNGNVLDLTKAGRMAVAS